MAGREAAQESGRALLLLNCRSTPAHLRSFMDNHQVGMDLVYVYTTQLREPIFTVCDT